MNSPFLLEKRHRYTNYATAHHPFIPIHDRSSKACRRSMYQKGSSLLLYDEEVPILCARSEEENDLRWGLIRKVYAILCAQLMLTLLLSSLLVAYQPISLFFLQNPGLYVLSIFLPFLVLCPLYYYHQKHPVNFLLLGLFIATLSLPIGITCAFTSGKVILESLVLTMASVVCLSAYTFWAARRGQDFVFLEPFLFTGIIILVLFSFIQVFFPIGRISLMIYGGLASLIFSGYIIYDTNNLIKRYTYDEYIWASVALYLDVINLFFALMDLCRGVNSS